MVEFRWCNYVRNWEIDYYNGLSQEESDKLKQLLNLDSLGCYYKSGDEWKERISGMCFKLTSTPRYPKLKEYLDLEFKKFIRKKKIQKINDNRIQ